jgi:C4-dicarboxylate transporter DctM subunit
MILLVSIVFLLLGIGVGIAWALAGAGIFTACCAEGFLLGMKSVASAFFDRSNSFILIALPLFLMMGEVVAKGGISATLFEAIQGTIPKLRGSMYYVTILTSALFAAVTGSSVGSASFLSKAIYPEMVLMKYPRKLAAGTIAVGGTLGILIPPSISMIVYGSLTSQSIGKLFIAGIIPGAILAFFFLIVGFVYARQMSFGAEVSEEKIGILQRIKAGMKAWPLVVLLGWVIVAIYTGLATPTEVAGVAVVMAIIIAAILKQFNLRMVLSASVGSCITSSMIIFIMLGAESVAYMLKHYGLIRQLLDLIEGAGITPLGLLLLVCGVYVILGMFMDGISMMALTVPFLYPLMAEMGFDLIWFGVVVTIMVELCLITPPVGLNLFVVSGGCAEPVIEVFKGVIPYILCVVVLLVLLTLFPDLATWLPSQI